MIRYVPPVRPLSDPVGDASSRQVSTLNICPSYRYLYTQSVEPVLSNLIYDSDKVQPWTDAIVESVLKGLASANKPFKYIGMSTHFRTPSIAVLLSPLLPLVCPLSIVTCVLMQRNGAGLHTASCSYWDSRSDAVCSVRWENPTIHCVISVFALRI